MVGDTTYTGQGAQNEARKDPFSWWEMVLLFMMSLSEVLVAGSLRLHARVI